MGVVWISLSAWSDITLVIAGCEWPIDTVDIPAIKSK